MKLTIHGHPRRNDMSEWDEIEKTINKAITLIEEVGAHELLTNSQIKLREVEKIMIAI